MWAKDAIETFLQLDHDVWRTVSRVWTRRCGRCGSSQALGSVCAFPARPLVAEGRPYLKNAIRAKLFPLSSLSQYWARFFVLFQYPQSCTKALLAHELHAAPVWLRTNEYLINLLWMFGSKDLGIPCLYLLVFWVCSRNHNGWLQVVGAFMDDTGRFFLTTDS